MLSAIVECEDDDILGVITFKDASLRAAAALLETLEHARAKLKLPYLDEATDDEVEEAFRMADTALA